MENRDLNWGGGGGGEGKEGKKGRGGGGGKGGGGRGEREYGNSTRDSGSCKRRAEQVESCKRPSECAK